MYKIPNAEPNYRFTPNGQYQLVIAITCLPRSRCLSFKLHNAWRGHMHFKLTKTELKGLRRALYVKDIFIINTKNILLFCMIHIKSVTMVMLVQLDCSSVTMWDYFITFCCRGPMLIPRPDSDTSAQTTRVNVPDFL